MTMDKKRKNLEYQDDWSPIYNKRSRPSNLCSSDDSRIDPTYGQRGAFPGLDDSRADNELFYGPANDGLEYLRMVRSEAKTVPNLLVAPSSSTAPSERDDLYADYPQGYYSDGAYTAKPLPHSNPSQAHTKSGQQDGQDPQEAYYASLCARFTEITAFLQSPPPRAAPANADVYYLEWKGPRLWRGKILYTKPTMILLSQLTQESIICGLEVLESLMTFANLSGTKGKNIGAWTWGLLCKCRDVGQMGSEEVGVLRKLGKQAVWLLRRISAGEVIGGAADEPDVDLGEEDEDEPGGEEEGVEDGAEFQDAVDADDGYSPYIDPITTAALGQASNGEAHPEELTSDADLAKAKQQMLDSLGHGQAMIESTATDASNEDGIQNATTIHPATEVEVDSGGSLTERIEEKEVVNATLDMLVTIIGNFYGQRDLLDGRLLWDEME